MRIGIICEGHSDRAVLENILRGVVDIDSNDLIALRPKNLLDETDLHIRKNIEFSNWSLVKLECEKKELIEDFLIAGGDFIVIHLDTAEADEYSVSRPVKTKDDHNYCLELRKNVVSKIDEWIVDQSLIDRTIHAVSIEEMDAWILTIYYDKNTCWSASPKEKLQYELGKKEISSLVSYDNYKYLSSDFTKPKKIRKGNYFQKNCSLALFVEEVKIKMILNQLKTSPETIDFKEVISFIDAHYDFTPTKFTNGNTVNEANENNGSCKVFSFAKLNDLSNEETLALFGAFYREDVLKNPEGSDHQNIRNFMEFGWEGITFEGEALRKRS